MELSEDAKQILRFLVMRMEMIEPDKVKTYYTEVHQKLNLDLVGPHVGYSLSRQGLTTLGEWAKHHGYPAVSGCIIRKYRPFRPGKGFFTLHGMSGKDANHRQWWVGQVRLSKDHDWHPHIDEWLKVKQGHQGCRP